MTDRQRLERDARSGVLTAINRLIVETGCSREAAMTTLLTSARAGRIEPFLQNMLRLSRDARGRSGDGFPSIRTLTLVVGGPDYAAPPVATLIMRRSGEGNNVISLRRTQSIQGRFSELTVLGQAHGTRTENGKHNIKATQKDVGVVWYRPKIVIDHEADSVAVARDRARKLLADSRLRGFSLNADVLGHRIVAPGEASHGKLWTPGQRVRVISERHEIDEIVFLMARRFTGSRAQGPRTALTLKEDGAWVLDAHPHKRKHRRGKNSAPGQILDLTTGAAK
jgi:prophage tail gpP-like protein